MPFTKFNKLILGNNIDDLKIGIMCLSGILESDKNGNDILSYFENILDEFKKIITKNEYNYAEKRDVMNKLKIFMDKNYASDLIICMTKEMIRNNVLWPATRTMEEEYNLMGN